MIKKYPTINEEPLLTKGLIQKKSRPSNLKLVVSLNKSIQGLAFNKDLYSSGKILNINLQYTFYDKKGAILSGQLAEQKLIFFRC